MREARIIGLIQARMGSVRLPGKAMLPLAGKPVIWHIVDRLRRVRGLSGVALATTIDPVNDVLVAYASELGLPTWRETDENDIAARLHNSCEQFGATAILKVNADCPLVDPSVLTALVDAYRNAPVDYVSNKIVWSFPKGLSAEVISKNAIEWCFHNLIDSTEREYVTDRIKELDSKFTHNSILSNSNYAHLDWMLDTPDDYDFMRRVFDSLYIEGGCFGMQDVLKYTSAEKGIV